jgi:sarcosine oxidase / L-pipecolate oxidase
MARNEKFHSKILIVGAGAFGTSTAFHLAINNQDPASVTVLDRAPVPSPRAASTDINKIVRADYSSPFYMKLAYDALSAWETWLLLKPYFYRTGWVMLDEKTSDLAERIRRNFKTSGRPDTSRDISLEEVRTKWGGVFRDVDVTDFDKAYTNPSSGWADASLAVKAMMQDAVSKGVRFEVGEVTELLTSGQGLEGVRTVDGRVYTANKILLATGAWTSWLMAPLEEALRIKYEDSIDRQICTTGVCTATFKLSAQEAEYYRQMPILIYGGRGEVMPPNRNRLFKFTNANTFTNTEQHPSGRRISVPPFQDQTIVPERLKQESIRIIGQRVPQMLDNGRQVDEWSLCWDAVSPDQNWLLTRHPDPRLSNLYFATGASLHSWKFLPTIGTYVVNILNGKSNGTEKDKAWKWKREWIGRGAHETVTSKGELRDFEDGGRPTSKL